MLKILPSHISNLIAAGEVVQRPASVIKELMENSVDSGADRISVIVNDAGRTLIQVVDNGCGMTKDEAVLSFKRHATSKIDTEEDLSRIMTYGFRGEALASIAAVSDITMKTRHEGEETGTEVNMKASELISVSEISTPKGTNIMVRNIFYNIPARRKFLKTDNAELKHIISEFIRVAIINSGISFSLTHNDRTVYNIPAQYNLKQRIQALIGKGFEKQLVPIKNDNSLIKIDGFICRPEDARKGTSQQFFFINGRFFKSALLYKAVIKGYGNLIQEGYSPSYFITISLDPEKTDVNIHPSKTEIKFEDEMTVFEFIRAGVREALGVNSFMPSIDFDTKGAVEMPSKAETVKEFNEGKRILTPPEIDFDYNFNPFNEEIKSGAGYSDPGSGEKEEIDEEYLIEKENREQKEAIREIYLNSAIPDTNIQKSEIRTVPSKISGRGYIPRTMNTAWKEKEETADANMSSGEEQHNNYLRKENGYGGMFEESSVTGSRQIIRIRNRFLVTTVKSGLLLISISRAKERILYEKYLKSLNEGEVAIVRTLHPAIMDFSLYDYSLIKDNTEIFSRLGFDICEPDHGNKDGENQLVVRGVPFEGLLDDITDLSEAIASITDAITENPEAVSYKPETIYEKQAGKMAKIGSRSRNELTTSEARILIDNLFACSNPGHTPSGEKTMNIMTIDNLENILKK